MLSWSCTCCLGGDIRMKGAVHLRDDLQELDGDVAVREAHPLQQEAPALTQPCRIISAEWNALNIHEDSSLQPQQALRREVLRRKERWKIMESLVTICHQPQLDVACVTAGENRAEVNSCLTAWSRRRARRCPSAGGRASRSA